MLVELPEYISRYLNDSFPVVPGFPQPKIEYFIFDWNLLIGCSITFFAFTCQASIIPIYSELVMPSTKRMMKVIGRSLTVDCVFYCAIALVGYFSTYNYTPQVVITRPTINCSDYAMTVGCLCVILVVLVSSPANFFPFKNTLNFMIYGTNEMS